MPESAEGRVCALPWYCPAGPGSTGTQLLQRREHNPRSRANLRVSCGLPGCSRSARARTYPAGYWLARDQALVGQQLAHLGHGRVRLRQDQLGWPQVVRRRRHAGPPDLAEQCVQGGPEGSLVVVLDRGLQRRVEPVELLDRGFRHLELAFPEDADDHSGSPAWPGSITVAVLAGSALTSLVPFGVLSICRGALPWASSVFIRSSSLSTPCPAPIRSSSA